MNWAVNYHVPIQEYGVHRNFFFTLAVVKVMNGSTNTVINT